MLKRIVLGLLLRDRCCSAVGARGQHLALAVAGSWRSRRRRRWQIDAKAVAERLSGAIRVPDGVEPRRPAHANDGEFDEAARLPGAAVSRAARQRSSAKWSGEQGAALHLDRQRPVGQADRADGAPGRGADRAGTEKAWSSRPLRGRRSRTASSGAAARWTTRATCFAQMEAIEMLRRPAASSRDRPSTWSGRRRGSERPARRAADRRAAASRAACGSTGCSTKACW